MESPRLHSDTPSALPAGTRLGEFEIRSLLGVGGFGIVYLAFDHSLEREVAIKEYMPASLAGRTETMHVTLRSKSDEETFELGRRSFVNEAKLLARFDHPSLLKVHRYWEANGTAYMVMPVLRGRTAKEIRLGMAGPPDEAWVRGILYPLLGALETLHAEGVYHRDVAPDNILIGLDGKPVLLDFGAARRVISDKSQTLTAILKPAYAPIEQYAEAGSVKQGPWTDLYALGATLHFLLATRPPPPATTRAVHDEPSALTPEQYPGCSADFLHTIDWMLAPRPADRPQSVAQLREVLDGRAPVPVRRVTEPSPSQWDRTVVLPAGATPGGLAASTSGAGSSFAERTTVAPRGGQGSGDLPPGEDQATVIVPPPLPPAAAPPGSSTPVGAGAANTAADDVRAPPVGLAPAAASSAVARGSARRLPVALGAGGLVVAVIAAALFWPREPAPAPPAPEAAASAPAVAVAPAPAPSVPESTVATVVLPGGVAPPSAGASVGGQAPAASPPPAAAPLADARPGPNPAPATATTPAPQQRQPAQTAQTTPVQRATNGSGSRPTPQAQVPATAPTQQAAAPAPAPAPEPVRQPPAAQPQPAAPPVAVASTPDPARLAGPEQRCGGRNPLSYFVCMERECLRSEFGSHADCLKWRASAKRE
jgi:serine/threonine protein kinase